MNLDLTFQEPRNVTPPELDGLVLRFPYTITRVGEGALKDETTSHSIDVLISDHLLLGWGYPGIGTDFHVRENRGALTKILFEFAKDKVVKSAKEGVLADLDGIDLLGTNAPATNPYDHRKIPYPEGFSVQIETAKPRIGFRSK